jgi:DNA-binding MurR/RpiR family transcriptional regulator
MASQSGKLISDLFADRLRERRKKLSSGAYRVARFIDRNRPAVLASSAAELAARIGTSDASVIRCVQTLGFKGLPDLKQALAATLEGHSTPADNLRRTMEKVGGAAAAAIDLVLDTQSETVEALRSEDLRSAIQRAVGILDNSERIVVFGIGPSAPLAHYMTILLSRDGRRSRALDATGIALADQLLDLQEGDVLLALAYGRAYPEIAAVLAEALRLAAPIVLISDSLDRKLAGMAKVIIPSPRGRAGQVALHGATLVTLEALAFGLAATRREQAMEALDRLNELRDAVRGKGEL